jgi:hypothetical protein
MTNQHTKSLGASIYMIVFFSFNDVILLCKLQRDLQQKQAEQIVRNMLHKDHERNIPIVYKLHQSLFFFSFFLKITVSILASKKALLYTIL